jgi:hypothetical protein
LDHIEEILIYEHIDDSVPTEETFVHVKNQIFAEDQEHISVLPDFAHLVLDLYPNLSLLDDTNYYAQMELLSLKMIVIQKPFLLDLKRVEA